jgi:hypothetical protein
LMLMLVLMLMLMLLSGVLSNDVVALDINYPSIHM